ncbi:MAG TPA: hypothetical protein VFA70_15375 [Dehalococcoidia bacterium]|nr:hypothetical protein [Dehalococcoidia bacterium]
MRVGRGVARRIAAIGAAGVAVSFGIGVMTSASPALAQGIPAKTCTDPSSPTGEAQPGDTITCTVDINGVLLDGSSYTVEPTAPTGAYITACGGATGGTSPDNYTSTATGTNLGGANSSCKWTISSTLPLTFNGQNQIGTEQLFIPASTAVGTSVTQQAKECVGTQCGPFTPMGVSGNGSCVGGTALPVVGGCAPGLPSSGSPSPSASTSPVAQGSPTPTGSVQGATTTPFTGGPTHPFPTAGAAIAAAGLAAGLGAFFGPSLLRRMRRLTVRGSGQRG